MTNKEHNFISAVVCVSDANRKTLSFLENLSEIFKDHFLKYEILVINRGGLSETNAVLKGWADEKACQLTVISMPSQQTIDQCMNAGIDLAIGDYVYEFDSADMSYPADLIWRAYEKATGGSDIVAVCPKTSRIGSRLFYALFSRCSSNGSMMRTEAFRLVSRRAVNRTHAMSENLPYRKAAYAMSGLKITTLEYLAGKEFSSHSAEDNRLDLAIDSLVLYTDFGYRLSIAVAIAMAFMAVCELGYTIAIYAVGKPVSGWTTTMFVLTLGLLGLFAIFIVVLKYLSLILRMTFQKQSYQVENIEKY